MTKFLNISTDNTLGGNSPSDETVSSQKAIKEYVDNHAGGSPAFANITGQPSDNANLAAALNGKANTDLSNLSATGQAVLDAKQDVATAVNYDNITNCITYIPQDIKLELNNGTLTLKAGSKVYIPNGAGVFDEVTIAEDKVNNISSSTPQTAFLFYNSQSGNFNGWYGPNIYSGSGAPSSSQVGTLWYDSTNNQFYWKNNNNWEELDNYSLPLGFGSWDGSKWTSIYQVFNGFGYIGSTVFALPGVKGLIPDERKDDGTLKSIEKITNTVLTYTWNSGLWGNNFPITISDWGMEYLGNENTYITGKRPENPTPYTRWYNEEKNYWEIYTDKWYKTEFYINGYVNLSDGKVTSLTPKTAFHAVDYNDFSDLSDKVSANTTAIATKANDADVMKLAGNQTITSTKTIDDNSLLFKDTTHTRAGETTAAWQTNQIKFLDKNGARVARIQPYYEANGMQRLTIAVDNGTENSFNFFNNGILTLGTLPSATNSKTDLWAATRGWVNDPSLSTNVVHRDGNETIGGTKTFTGQINSSYGVAYGSNSQIMGIQGFTSDGKLASLVQGWTKPNANTTGIYSFNPSGQYEGITVTIDSNGNVATYAPTPATSDNSTKIATTAYVNNKFKVVSALPASPDSSTFYFITA